MSLDSDLVNRVVEYGDYLRLVWEVNPIPDGSTQFSFKSRNGSIEDFYYINKGLGLCQKNHQVLLYCKIAETSLGLDNLSSPL